MMTSNLSRFNPVAALSLFEPLRALDDLMRDSGMEWFWPATAGSGGIRLDVRETDQAFDVEAELPGLKKDDIKVAIDGRQVSLSAQAAAEQQQQRDGMLWRERHAGQWYRSFTLPHEVDESQAQARYEDGVLRLTLPKKAGAGGTRLAIQ
ncbi:HSP20 family protein [Duganella sp. 1411]|jgi:HSP20 family protein|uniref:Hsp20/alpha crystallin family protein n=1 Tax=Duganella sp. 1411 TaxID=2806572 RepID=UPI001B721E28|nr:Hsp20/alpha crystallin family protein [Duganella sp. 1411]MBP1202073.1 HSP20 family protein [Duganella sp. 1411]